MLKREIFEVYERKNYQGKGTVEKLLFSGLCSYSQKRITQYPDKSVIVVWNMSVNRDNPIKVGDFVKLNGLNFRVTQENISAPPLSGRVGSKTMILEVLDSV